MRFSRRLWTKEPQSYQGTERFIPIEVFSLWLATRYSHHPIIVSHSELRSALIVSWGAKGVETMALFTSTKYRPEQTLESIRTLHNDHPSRFSRNLWELRSSFYRSLQKLQPKHYFPWSRKVYWTNSFVRQPASRFAEMLLSQGQHPSWRVRSQCDLCMAAIARFEKHPNWLALMPRL